MAPIDEQKTRSRKKITSNGGSINPIGNGIYITDSGSSAREERLSRRKSRVKKARARRSKKEGTSLCLVASAVFVIYLLVCLVLFRSMPEARRQVGISKVKDVMRKTKERVKKTKDKVISKLRHVDTGKAIVEISPPAGIPVGKWPVSIRDEEHNFEEIAHPGHEDGSVKMDVPRFWADDPVTIHRKKQLSRERAMAIGTCVKPDENGSNMRGDQCPQNERTIFVAIASYRDFQCRDTVDSLFSRADHPERVRVGKLLVYRFVHVTMKRIYLSYFVSID